MGILLAVVVVAVSELTLAHHQQHLLGGVMGRLVTLTTTRMAQQ
jgi:hypothetical protein